MPLRLYSLNTLSATWHFATRTYRTTSIRALPYKDSQDRESLKPRTAEHTKSGRDDDAAASDVAFKRDVTSPEAARKIETKEHGGDPLEVSGANQELSKPQGDEKVGNGLGAGKETRKGGRSGGGNAAKRGSRSK